MAPSIVVIRVSVRSAFAHFHLPFHKLPLCFTEYIGWWWHGAVVPIARGWIVIVIARLFIKNNNTQPNVIFHYVQYFIMLYIYRVYYYCMLIWRFTTAHPKSQTWTLPGCWQHDLTVTWGVTTEGVPSTTFLSFSFVFNSSHFLKSQTNTLRYPSRFMEQRHNVGSYSIDCDSENNKYRLLDFFPWANFSCFYITNIVRPGIFCVMPHVSDRILESTKQHRLGINNF